MTWDTNEPRNRASHRVGADRAGGTNRASRSPCRFPRLARRTLRPRQQVQEPDPGAHQDALVTARFAIGFALGLFGTLFVAGAAAFGLSRAYDGRIMPGVRAGTVDLSGLTRDEAISKLDSGYASLGQGKIVVTTPGGIGTFTYQEVGRGPDSAAMVDAALAQGRADNQLASIALTVRTFAVGSSVPIVVKLDPMALETRLHQMTGVSLVPPKDASVAISGADHEIVPAAAGRGIDENVIATQLISQLSSTDAPAELQVGAKFVTIEPNVSDADAQAAAASVGNMSVAVTLTNGDKTWTIDAAGVHSWIIFGARTNGTYGPAVNPASVKTFVATLAKDVNADPVEPKVIYKDGQPNGLSAGKPGRGTRRGRDGSGNRGLSRWSGVG